MKLSKWMLASFASVLLLSACTPSVSKDAELTQQSESDEEVETTHIPSMQLSDDYYKTLVPYKESATRGLVVSNINTKYDIKEVEKGLMRISQSVFSTDDYYFQEGQYITKSTVENWLARPNQTTDQKKTEQGLNPSSVDAETGADLEPEIRAEEAPIYLAHIVEQNYLKKVDDNKVGLGGISIGLALNSIYYYQKEQYGEYYERPIDDKELLKEGEKIAQSVIERLRQRPELADIPIVIGLFKQQAKNSIVPGTYMQFAISDSGKNTLGEWKIINEEYKTFPMSSPDEKYRELNNKFLSFKQDIDEYFANFTSVIGTAFYKDNQVDALEINIPIQFFGTAEVIGFTQYLTGVILSRLPENINITVSITSVNGAEALIKKEPNNNDPFVHIYE
jgi:protein involved in sex pheromone biosynthesis